MKIRFHDLTKQYGNTTALHPLNLDIHDGEFLVILGSSGSGKSTTLNILAGLEAPTSGYLFFHERMVNHVPPGKRDVALVFQNYALYPHMRVYDNIVFPLKIRKAGDSHQKVTKTAEMLGMVALLQKYPKELSGGERQRVALARALVRNPQVFLMDEPLSNLDARLRISARGELKKLQRERNITTIYVTHDQAEALTLGDRIAIMDKGRLQQVGTPNEVYEKPQNMFVAGFVGTPPMNMAQISIDNPRSFKIGGVVVEYPVLLPETKDVILGIRPEKLTLVPPRSPLVITGKIVHREYLGSESISHVEITKTIQWYLKGNAAEGTKTGDMVGLQFSPEDTHWFDPVTGVRIEY